jgi:hypothetical protein
VRYELMVDAKGSERIAAVERTLDGLLEQCALDLRALTSYAGLAF